jgi:DNA-binding transcriptional ArsR family regulator
MDLPLKNNRNFLTINATDGLEVLKGLSSPVRMNILKLLHSRGPLNVNEISDALSLPQSTVATNVQVLESCDLIRTETVKATKGQQKICAARFDEIVLRFDDYDLKTRSNVIELSMPLGLYTNCSVSPPCGLCSTENVLGLLDVPEFFLDPGMVPSTFTDEPFELLLVSMKLSSDVSDGTTSGANQAPEVVAGMSPCPFPFGPRRSVCPSGERRLVLLEKLLGLNLRVNEFAHTPTTFSSQSRIRLNLGSSGMQHGDLVYFLM